MSTQRGQNGSAHGRASLAAKRERYENELAEKAQAAKPSRPKDTDVDRREGSGRGKAR